MDLVCFNGNFFSADEPLFTSQNRSYRYGDGVFETLKVYKGKILFESYHFERLLLGLKMLQINCAVTTSDLASHILHLCKKNNCTDLGRIRLSVYRNEKNEAEYCIEASQLSNEFIQWNEKGFTVGLYPYARKNADAFSNLKTANFLPYVLAALFAKEKNWDDAIVMNAGNHICDTSKANIFLIKNNELFTPALHQGCISGIMRRFLLDGLKQKGQHVHQQEISEQQLMEADEIFLTNSIFDMQWIGFFKEKTYTYQKSLSVYNQLLKTIYF